MLPDGGLDLILREQKASRLIVLKFGRLLPSVLENIYAINRVDFKEEGTLDMNASVKGL
jgi:hypothetical protein